jgi:hypothetical protein
MLPIHAENLEQERQVMLAAHGVAFELYTELRVFPWFLFGNNQALAVHMSLENLVLLSNVILLFTCKIHLRR